MGPKEMSEILLVGSELRVNERLRAELLVRGYGVITASCGEEGLAKAIELDVDVVVSELMTTGLSGLELLSRVHSANPRLPVILIAGAGDMDSAIEAARSGAYEYVAKPFDISELVELVGKAASTKGAVVPTLAPGEAGFAQTGLVGSSRMMQKLYKQIGLASDSSVTILIQGATGTGKELIARAIHLHSGRAKQRFIAVNCSAIPETLFESELFGYEAGAFTGARSRRVGWFEQANLGTLFLDEIGDLTVATQVKLLRVLQEGCIHPVGSRLEVRLDVRVVAATHRDLERRIDTGEFRQDLFYRLSGFTISPPELGEHREDILELVKHFLRKYQKDQAFVVSIEREAVDFLEKQVWPGDVRQLENTVRASAILARGQPINLGHVQLACGRRKPPAEAGRRIRGEPLTDLLDRAQSGEIRDLRARVMQQTEHSLLERAMALAKGNQAKVARWLGVTRTTVREKLRHFGILSPGQDVPPRENGPKRLEGILGQQNLPSRNRCPSEVHRPKIS